MKKFNRFFTVLMFVFLYAPMAVLIVASFNTGKDITQFEGFTLLQYVRLFRDNTLLSLLGNSVLVAILSSLIATAFGTVAALGINALSPKMRKLAMTLTDIPMTNPDIVTGVSLSLLFIFVGSNLLGQKESLTFWTLLIAHITFNLPYPIVNLLKLHLFNRRTRYDHAVKIFILIMIEGLIKCRQMLLGNILRFVSCRVHKIKLNLERRVTEKTGKLCFGIYFCGHEIEKKDAERTDILRDRTVFRHHKYVFLLKHSRCRKLVWYFNRHNTIPL